MSANKILSSPETGPYWISPSYSERSLEQVGSLMVELLDSVDKPESETIKWLDVGSGGGLQVEEAVERYKGGDTLELLADMLEMDPPEYARNISDEYPEVNLIEGGAPANIPEEEFDLVSIVNAGQYFDQDELTEFVDKVESVLNPGGKFAFNSIYNLFELFEELEQYSEEQMVFEESGSPYIETDVFISPEDFDLEAIGVETPVESTIMQQPREFSAYIHEILGGRQFRGDRFGFWEVPADVEDLSTSIESLTREDVSKDEELNEYTVKYEWGVVKKTQPGVKK